LTSVLPTISAPTLVIAHAGNPYILPQQSLFLAEHITNARHVVLSGEDHLYWVGDLDGLADEIEKFLTGAAAGSVPDRLLANVLFTDIVGSTDTAAELGDQRWRRLLDRHDEVVRRQVERFRGSVVNTTGDGFVTLFDGPGRAVRCACAIRDAVRPLASTSELASTRVKSNNEAATWLASPSTSPPESPHAQNQARSWSHEQSSISPPGPASASSIAANMTSRAFPKHGASTP